MATKQANEANNNGIREPLYVLSLTVQNIRCFGDEPQKLVLSDGDGRPAQWTLLLGNNGTGKTTLLQAITGFTAVEFPGEPIIETLGDLPFFFRGLNTHFLRQLERNVAPDGAMLDLEFALANSIRDKPIATGRAIFGSKSGASVPGALPLCFAYGSGRKVSATLLSREENGVDDIRLSMFDEEVSLRNPEEWLLRLDYSASVTSEVVDEQRRRRDQVLAVLADLLPDVDNIRIAEPTKQHRAPRVEFKTPDGWIELRNVAYGYRSLVAWIVDFASRLIDEYPDSPHPLEEAAVCLVDEIDLHLHPSWQRDLMGYLSKKFPNTQFIATAHSPLIVQAAPSVNANVAVLRRVGDHVVIDNDAEVVRGWRLDQILASDLYNVPARAPDVQAKIDERRKILEKPKLSKVDKEKLKRLEAEIGLLPVGETPEQIKAMQLLQDSVSALQNAVDREA